MVKVKEIFTSIQGEGPFVGYKQLFIRLCGCNLNCKYCDTDFSSENAKNYTLEELLAISEKYNDCHSVSLTGGEPLLSIDFIKEFSKRCKLPIYLETNGVLYKQLSEVIDFIDYISADIKLTSVTGFESMWNEQDKFFEIASKKKLFAKVVFDDFSTQEEITKITDLCKKYNIELILQPRMQGRTSAIDSSFMQYFLDECLKHYHKVRLIPQVHKFINVI